MFNVAANSNHVLEATSSRYFGRDIVLFLGNFFNNDKQVVRRACCKEGILQ